MQSKTPLCYRLTTAFLVVAILQPASAQLIQDSTIEASNGVVSDGFGVSIATAGDWVLAGAPWADGAATRAGTAYLTNSVTGQQYELVPGDPALDGFFGGSVAMTSGRQLVGAYFTDNLGVDSGSAYYFGGGLGQLAQLLPLDGGPGRLFGRSVDLDANHLVIGSPLSPPWGAVYVFDPQTPAALTGRLQTFKLESPGTQWLGVAVSIQNERIVAGAPVSVVSGIQSGKAVVFDSATGQELWHLEASDAGAGAGLGSSVDQHGSLVAIGAPNHEQNGSSVGAVYLFSLANGQQVAKLLAPDGIDGARFGSSVEIDDTHVLVGAPYAEENGVVTGAAYLYEIDGTFVTKMIPSDGGYGDRFGSDLALMDQGACVGAYAAEAGRAYVYERRTPLATEVLSATIPNSTGVAGKLYAQGSNLVADGNFNLHLRNIPSGEFGFFLTSQETDLVFLPGDSSGILLLGGSIGRFNAPHQILQADVFGQATLSLPSLIFPTPSGPVPVVAGETHYFQYWHRDWIGGTQTSNFSHAIGVSFQ